MQALLSAVANLLSVKVWTPRQITHCYVACMSDVIVREVCEFLRKHPFGCSISVRRLCARALSFLAESLKPYGVSLTRTCCTWLNDFRPVQPSAAPARRCEKRRPWRRRQKRACSACRGPARWRRVASGESSANRSRWPEPWREPRLELVVQEREWEPEPGPQREAEPQRKPAPPRAWCSACRAAGGPGWVAAGGSSERSST